MVLHSSPYASGFLSFLDGLSWAMVFPSYWLLDRLLASCVSTSLEKHRRSQEPCSFLTLCLLVSAPLYLLLFLASMPLALLGFLLWAPLQAVRTPYLYTHCRPDKHQAEQVSRWKPRRRLWRVRFVCQMFTDTPFFFFFIMSVIKCDMMVKKKRCLCQ